MTRMSKLQSKMGGPAGQLDKAAIVLAAQRNLDAVTPKIELALEEQRQVLRAALSQTEPPLQDIFGAAHQIRGMAGSIGRPSLGALADVLATYITECVDAGLVCAEVPLRALASALDRSFDQAEDDALSIETLAAAKHLARLFGPARRSAKVDFVRS